MKVMHIVESFGGGVYTFLKELCNATTDKVDTVIVYSVRKETPKNFKDEFNDKIKFIYIDMCRGFNISKNITSLLKLKKTIINEKPDIVHLHSSKAGFLGRIACKNIGFNMNNVYYNPHGFSFLQKNENFIKRKLYYFLEKYASKMGGKIIGCSKGEANVAKQISRNVININNSVNLDEINSIIKNFNKQQYITSNKMLIGTVGRINYQKNPQLFNDIAKCFPDTEFIWIGDGQLRKELTSKNIKVTGWLSRKQVIREVSKLDIFIMTSLWEGLPISLLEAMYLKKICIVNNTIGCRDVIIDKINGFIANNLNDYYNIIRKYKNNQLNVNQIQNNAFNDVKNNYCNKKMIEDYLSLYFNKI